MVEFTAVLATENVPCRSGRLLEIHKTTAKRFDEKLTVVLEKKQEPNPMTPEFYLVLNDEELSETLENAVFIAGFDDSELTMRGSRAAVWICHRKGELTELVRQALTQARQGGLSVSHVEIENEVFA